MLRLPSYFWNFSKINYIFTTYFYKFSNMFATYMWHLSSCGSVPFTVQTPSKFSCLAPYFITVHQGYLFILHVIFVCLKIVSLSVCYNYKSITISRGNVTPIFPQNAHHHHTTCCKISMCSYFHFPRVLPGLVAVVCVYLLVSSVRWEATVVS